MLYAFELSYIDRLKRHLEIIYLKRLACSRWSLPVSFQLSESPGAFRCDIAQSAAQGVQRVPLAALSRPLFTVTLFLIACHHHQLASDLEQERRCNLTGVSGVEYRRIAAIEWQSIIALYQPPPSRSAQLHPPLFNRQQSGQQPDEDWGEGTNLPRVDTRA